MPPHSRPAVVATKHPIPPTLEMEIGEVEEIEKSIFFALTSKEALKQIAIQSYVHRNGFLKLTLSSLNGKKQRIHIFDVGTKADGNIHNHRWNFHSKVLCGSLPMFVYNIIDGEDYYFHTYLRKNLIYIITPQGFCGVVESPLFFINAGTSYTMPKETHHRIGAVEELTITLMATEETDQSTCDLINSQDQSGGGREILEAPLDVETVLASLRLVLLKIQVLKEELEMELV